MRVYADHRGLHAIVDADASISYVSDLRLAVQRRDVSGASFAFRAHAVEWLPEDPPVRRVTDAAISELSIVTFPAFLGTSVSVSDAPRSYALPKEDSVMRHRTVEVGLEYAAPRSSHDRRDLALHELRQAQHYWQRNPRAVFELRYAPPRTARTDDVSMPSARKTSLTTLTNWQRQREAEATL
jgi:hypothetical protein